MKLVQRLPRKPDLIVAKLRQSLRGCMWMLEEWRNLAGHVRGTPAGGSPRPLDELGRRRAGDLLGLSAERRLGSYPARPPRWGRLGGRGGRASAALIATQIAALEALTGEERVALDESIRVDTMNGTNLTIDDQIRLIRRYETEARRVKERAFAKLQELKDIAAALKKAAEESASSKNGCTFVPCPGRCPRTRSTQAWARKAPPPVASLRPSSSLTPSRKLRVCRSRPPRSAPWKLAAKQSWPRKKLLPLTAELAAPAVLPVASPRPLTRRARKIHAARAAPPHAA